MLLIYFLGISIVILLAFALSKETGKNTKHARRGASSLTELPQVRRRMNTTDVIEIN
jgi:hypothetical protein